MHVEGSKGVDRHCAIRRYDMNLRCMSKVTLDSTTKLTTNAMEVGAGPYMSLVPAESAQWCSVVLEC